MNKVMNIRQPSAAAYFTLGRSGIGVSKVLKLSLQTNAHARVGAGKVVRLIRAVNRSAPRRDAPLNQ